MPAMRCPPHASLLRSLRQATPASFRQHQREHGCYKESARLQQERRADAMLNGQSADRKRGNGRDSAADVVAQTHGYGADFARKNFAGDCSVTRKKSRPKERHEWS